MTLFRLLVLILLVFSPSAHAEIEKFATTTDSGVVLQWWPKVQPPPGWSFDSGSSHHFGFNAMAPDGSTFSKAETVMYAKADYKPRVPEIKSLALLIKADVSDFQQAYPGLAVTTEPSISSADHQQFQVVTFAPSTGGNWERVAYGEDAEFYLVFTVSSRTKSGLEHAMTAFKSMVGSYRAGP